MSRQKFLLAPTAVAVVGASERLGPGRNVFENLLASDAKLEIFPVNPRHSTILGHRTYPDLESLPSTPDLVVISIPAVAVPQVLEEAAERGVQAAVILSSGFAESGADGQALQEHVTTIAQEYGMAVCGPNCMGFVNRSSAINAFSGLIPKGSDKGNVACFAQSGSVAISLINAMGSRISIAVSGGNQAVTDAADFLELFAKHEATTVYGFFLESLPRSQTFLRYAGQASASGKPVVICRTGRSEQGAAATTAHTGALAQPHEAFDEIASRYGVIVVEDLDEMSDVLTLFSAADSGKNNRGGVALASVSGGLNALVLDLAHQLGLKFAELGEHTLRVLADLLPNYGTPSNPLDVTASVMADRERYRQCLTALAQDDAVDLVAVIIPMANPEIDEQERYRFDYMMEAAQEASLVSERPIIILPPVASPIDSGFTERTEALGLPLMSSLRSGLSAIGRMQRWLRRDTNRPIHSSSPKPLGTHPFEMPIPHQKVTTSPKEAMAFAEKLGYPVVLKVASPAIPHKTDVGGVRLGISTSEALGDEWQQLVDDVQRNVPTAPIDGVLVAQEIGEGVDLIVGLKRDSELGPLIVVGMGGIYAEILSDRAIAQAPISTDIARDLVQGLRCFPLLEGARGLPKSDLEALYQFLVAFSIYVCDEAEVYTEIDLNPVRVMAHGKGLKVLDTFFFK